MAGYVKKDNWDNAMNVYGDVTVKDLLMVQEAIATYLDNVHGIDQAELADKTNAINNDLVRQYGKMIQGIEVDMGDSEVDTLTTCIYMLGFAVSAVASASACLPTAHGIIDRGLFSALADKIIEDIEEEIEQ